ncbi:MAG: serine--tRNA ligase, partial [Fervidobacterium sp.]
MIDLKVLRKDPKIFYEALEKRNYPAQIVDEILELDKEWRNYLNIVNNLKAKR